MKHPQLKCPDQLKPVFKQVREQIVARMAESSYPVRNLPTYICHRLRDSNHPEAEAAVQFISNSLRGYDNVLTNWLATHDTEYQELVWSLRPLRISPERLMYEDNARITWLTYLIGEDNATPV